MMLSCVCSGAVYSHLPGRIRQAESICRSDCNTETRVAQTTKRVSLRFFAGPDTRKNARPVRGKAELVAMVRPLPTHTSPHPLRGFPSPAIPEGFVVLVHPLPKGKVCCLRQYKVLGWANTSAAKGSVCAWYCTRECVLVK